MSRPIDSTALYKDIPRLSAKAEIRVASKLVYSPLGPAASTKAFVSALARAVGDPQADALVAALEQRLSKGADDDQAGFEYVRLRAAFDAVTAGFTEFSKTLAAMRYAHQGIVMPPAFWLKSRTRLATVDARGPLGWRLLFEVDDDRQHLALSHIRRERSPVDDEYLVTYTIRLRISLAAGGNDEEPPKLSVRFGVVNAKQPDHAAFDDLKRWNETAEKLGM